VRLLGSGAILREVTAAAELLLQDWEVGSDVYSVTSFSELAREAREIERWNRLHPLETPRRSYVALCLDGPNPIITATDYVRAYPQLIAAYVEAKFIALGTDGFGRSDTRTSLRRYFEVDRHSVCIAALQALAESGALPRTKVARALEQYGIAETPAAPWLM
jgi:pyruvate dehydrogenase E1 component